MKGIKEEWHRLKLRGNSVYSCCQHGLVTVMSSCLQTRRLMNPDRGQSHGRRTELQEGIPANPSWESISAGTRPLREYTSLAPVSSEEHLHCRALVRAGTCSLISLNAHLSYTWGTLSLSLSPILTKHLWDSLPSLSPSLSAKHLGDFSFLPPRSTQPLSLISKTRFRWQSPRVAGISQAHNEEPEDWWRPIQHFDKLIISLGA